MQHSLGGIKFLVWEIFMTYDEYVGSWTLPHHHPKIIPYKHHTLHPILLSYIWTLVYDEGEGVQHPRNFWCFSLMEGSYAPGLWHCVSLIFVIFAILQSMKWPAPDYHNSLIFMSESRQNIAKMPLLSKNMVWNRQLLMYMFRIRYGFFATN